MLLGHMSSLEKLVPSTRLQMRSLQWHLKSNWSTENDPPHLPVLRSQLLDRDISWWMTKKHLLERMPFAPPPPKTPPILGRVSVGVGSPPPRSISVGTMIRPRDLTPHQCSGDESSVPGSSSLPGHGRQPASDSNVRQLHGSGLHQQIGGAGGGGTVSDSLCELTGQLLRWTEAHNVLLEARYLPGQSNVLADLLSHLNQVLAAEWSLLPQVAKKIIHTWGSPTIDLFATHLNAKLPLYCSLILDPQAVFEDAFRHPWNNLDVYAFPPFHLVERVVARVRETPNLSMTLIAPSGQRRPGSPTSFSC